MSAIRGPLFRLKAKDFDDLDHSRSPLLQQVDRSKRDLKKLRDGLQVQRQRHNDTLDGRNLLLMSKLMRFREKDPSHLGWKGEEPLGNVIADWKQAGFELSSTKCELQCHTTIHSRVLNQTQTLDNTVSLGFVQAHTKVSEGPMIETVDRNVRTTEKLRLYTLEIVFHCDNAIYPRYCVVGHPDMQERDRWLAAILDIIKRKVELQNGWHSFYNTTSLGQAVKDHEWEQLRAGQVAVQLNMKARRKARLQNGKVLQDVPIVFEKFSEDCCDWPITDPDGNYYGKAKVMDASRIIDALAELGLELTAKTAQRLLDEVQKNPPCLDIPDKVDLKRFMVIFKSCLQEMMVSPSAEMKQNLMRIMQDSKNPFLSLLSPAEQMYLIEGRDADGHNVCVCKSYSKDTVLVKQNDDGDSMFLIIEGQLSVIVAFGSGSSTTQKEVAVLPSGAVMGEMSLVLGKPRSATCVVKSETASVAEIAKSAMIKLLDSRPSLARELEDIVYRRDASNYLTAGKAGVNKNNTEAMAAYRVRGEHKPDNVPPAWPVEQREASGCVGCVRPMSRIQSRLSKAKRPISSCSYPALRPPATAPPPLDAATTHRVKSGRWVKGKGVFVFLVD